MKVVVDPTKNFDSSVYGADDLLKNFPDLRAGGKGVYVEQDEDDPDIYNIVDENGNIIDDCCFFSTDELFYLIVTDDGGNITQMGKDPMNDVAEIPGVIRRGSSVRNEDGLIGVVVRIDCWGRKFEDLDDEHHGTLTVWQRDEANHGDDNCKHYTLTNFGDFITVLEY